MIDDGLRIGKQSPRHAYDSCYSQQYYCSRHKQRSFSVFTSQSSSSFRTDICIETPISADSIIKEQIVRIKNLSDVMYQSVVGYNLQCSFLKTVPKAYRAASAAAFIFLIVIILILWRGVRYGRLRKSKKLFIFINRVLFNRRCGGNYVVRIRILNSHGRYRVLYGVSLNKLSLSVPLLFLLFSLTSFWNSYTL